MQTSPAKGTEGEELRQVCIVTALSAAVLCQRYSACPNIWLLKISNLQLPLTTAKHYVENQQIGEGKIPEN